MPVREYIFTVSKYFGGHLSGWVFALIGIGSTVVAALLPHYFADPGIAILLLNWTARISAVVFVYFLFVAPYEAWKEQRDERIEAERKLGLLAQTGPEVWLSFVDSASYVGFIVENRSLTRDAIQVCVDPFETTDYRATPGTLSLLRRGDTQALRSTMDVKKDEIHFIDLPLGEMLKDSSDSFNCSLQFTLRYQDSWGNRYSRRATIDAHRIELEIDDLPHIVNHAIERDQGNAATGHRFRIPLGETTTSRPLMSVD